MELQTNFLFTLVNFYNKTAFEYLVVNMEFIDSHNNILTEANNFPGQYISILIYSLPKKSITV